MLGKLLKYDLKWTYRGVIVFYTLAIVFSIIGRLLSEIENSLIFNIIGKVCMDSFMVDLTEVDDAKVGDEVIIWDNDNITLEELAEKIYVTRQSISNWENGKTYPDIHSLLLLSSLFGISLDQLVKGDIEIMKEAIKEEEVKKMKQSF